MSTGCLQSGHNADLSDIQFILNPDEFNKGIRYHLELGWSLIDFDVTFKKLKVFSQCQDCMGVNGFL